MDIAQYPFKGKQRRIVAWRCAQVKHDLVEPGSDLAEWVYAHNLSTETLSETDEEEVIANLRAEERTRRKGKKQEQQDMQQDDPADEAAETGYDGPTNVPLTKNTQFPMDDATDDDGFLRVAATRKGKRLGVTFDVPPKGCLENYTAVDVIEFALAEARRTGGQTAVDNLTRRMAKERVSCLTSK